MRREGPSEPHEGSMLLLGTGRRRHYTPDGHSGARGTPASSHLVVKCPPSAQRRRVRQQRQQRHACRCAVLVGEAREVKSVQVSHHASVASHASLLPPDPDGHADERPSARTHAPRLQKRRTPSPLCPPSNSALSIPSLGGSLRAAPPPLGAGSPCDDSACAPLPSLLADGPAPRLPPRPPRGAAGGFTGERPRDASLSSCACACAFIATDRATDRGAISCRRAARARRRARPAGGAGGRLSMRRARSKLNSNTVKRKQVARRACSPACPPREGRVGGWCARGGRGNARGGRSGRSRRPPRRARWRWRTRAGQARQTREPRASGAECRLARRSAAARGCSSEGGRRAQGCM